MSGAELNEPRPSNYSIQLEREIAGLEHAIQGEPLARETADLDLESKGMRGARALGLSWVGVRFT
jgi:hypothetical protein